MFQTPPGVVVIPGLAGMTLQVRYLHDVILSDPYSQFPTGAQGNTPESLSNAADGTR